MKYTLGLLLSFLLGSIPTAYCVGKLVRGIDIRKEGSGNIGATNAFRVIGKGWGLAIMLFDLAKGFIAAAFIPRIQFADAHSVLTVSLLFGIAAILGHTWTPWLGFRGGKGVATSAGVFLAVTPQALGAALVVWTGLFIWRRYVSLASLGAAISFPIWIFCFFKESKDIEVLLPVGLTLTVFIAYTHRENIKRLLEGREKKII